MDGSPVVAITGMTFHDLIGTRYQQGVDTTKLMQDVALYNVEVTGPEHAMLVTNRACRVALGDRGVAHLSVSLLSIECAPAAAPAATTSQSSSSSASPSSPSCCTCSQIARIPKALRETPPVVYLPCQDCRCYPSSSMPNGPLELAPPSPGRSGSGEWLRRGGDRPLSGG
jgi:thiamine pyrophosphate-dependent acetolactate synthase large subunit-like protein